MGGAPVRSGWGGVAGRWRSKRDNERRISGSGWRGSASIVRDVVINKLNLTCAFLPPLYSSELMSRFPFDTTRTSSDPCPRRLGFHLHIYLRIWSDTLDVAVWMEPWLMDDATKIFCTYYQFTYSFFFNSPAWNLKSSFSFPIHNKYKKGNFMRCTLAAPSIDRFRSHWGYCFAYRRMQRTMSAKIVASCQLQKEHQLLKFMGSRKKLTSFFGPLLTKRRWLAFLHCYGWQDMDFLH